MFWCLLLLVGASAINLRAKTQSRTDAHARVVYPKHYAYFTPWSTTGGSVRGLHNYDHFRACWVSAHLAYSAESARRDAEIDRISLQLAARSAEISQMEDDEAERQRLLEEFSSDRSNGEKKARFLAA